MPASTWKSGTNILLAATCDLTLAGGARAKFIARHITGTWVANADVLTNMRVVLNFSVLADIPENEYNLQLWTLGPGTVTFTGLTLYQA